VDALLSDAGPLGPLGLLVLAMVAAVGLLLAARIVTAPAVAAGLLVVVVVANLSEVVGEVGPASVYLAALGLAVLTLVLGVLRGEVSLQVSPMFVLFGVFVAVRALSVLFADGDVGAGIAELSDEVKGGILLVVLTTLLAASGRVSRMAELAVAAVAALAALTAVQELGLGAGGSLAGLSNVDVASEVAGLDARHSGPQLDPNFWCRVLVLILPLALALMWSRSERPENSHRAEPGLRWGWAGAAGLLLVGAYLSQSRGGMIAIFCTGVLTLALLVRNRVRLLAGAVLVVLVFALIPGVGDRLATLGSLNADSPGAVDLSLRGREAAQEAGLAMFRDSPLIGVGAANFEIAGDRYQRELGIRLGGQDELLAPHDIYIQQLSEGGVVGIVGYAAFWLGSIVVMLATRRRWRALRELGLAGESELRLSSAVVASLVGWGIASMFLHLATLPVLLVIVSFGAALQLQARRAEADSGLGDLLTLSESARPAAGHPAGWIGPSRGQRITLTVIGVALAAGAGVATRQAVDTRTGYGAEVRVAIQPSAAGQAAGQAGAQAGVVPGAGNRAYSFDVLDRARTVPTIVVLADALRAEAAADIGLPPGVQQHVQTSAVRDGDGNSFRIRVVADEADDARVLAGAMADRLSRYLRDVGSLYDVRVLARSPAEEIGSDRPVWLTLAGGLGALGLTVLVAAARPRRQTGPSGGDPFDEPDGYVLAESR
jgi:O-antigen ligase